MVPIRMSKQVSSLAWVDDREVLDLKVEVVAVVIVWFMVELPCYC